MLGGAALTRALCRGGLRQGLCLRAGSPMRATPSTGSALMDRIVGNDFDGHLAEVQQKNAGRPVEPEAQARPRRRCAAAAPGRPRGDPAAPRRAEPRRAGAGAAVLGRRRRSRACRSRRSCRTSTSACSTNSSGATGRTAARSPSTRSGRGRSCGRSWRASPTSRSARTSWCRRRPTATGAAPPKATT